MKNQPLPCPFCGCTTIREFKVFERERYRIDCNACNCGAEANDRQTALARWNRRSDRAPPALTEPKP